MEFSFLSNSIVLKFGSLLSSQFKYFDYTKQIEAVLSLFLLEAVILETARGLVYLAIGSLIKDF